MAGRGARGADVVSPREQLLAAARAYRRGELTDAELEERVEAALAQTARETGREPRRSTTRDALGFCGGGEY